MAQLWGPLGRALRGGGPHSSCPGTAGALALCSLQSSPSPERPPRGHLLPPMAASGEVDGSGLLAPLGTAPKDPSSSRSPGRTHLCCAYCDPASRLPGPASLAPGPCGRLSRTLPSRKPSHDALLHLTPSCPTEATSRLIPSYEDVSRGCWRRRQS